MKLKTPSLFCPVILVFKEIYNIYMSHPSAGSTCGGYFLCFCSKNQVLCTKTFSCVGCVPIILLRTFSHLLIIFPENFNTVSGKFKKDTCVCVLDFMQTQNQEQRTILLFHVKLQPWFPLSMSRRNVNGMVWLEKLMIIRILTKMQKHINISRAFTLHYKTIHMYKSSNGRFSETRKMNSNYNE